MRRPIPSLLAGLALLVPLLTTSACGGSGGGEPPGFVLDTGFGSGGMTTFAVAPDDERLTTYAAHPDGRHIVGGTLSGGGFLVAALLADGGLDPSFGSGGIFLLDTPQWTLHDLVVHPTNGRITVVGVFDESELGMVRLNADGTGDASFGFLGLSTVDAFAGNDFKSVLRAHISTADLLTVLLEEVPGNPRLVRITSAGGLDPTFGGGDGIFPLPNIVGKTEVGGGLTVDAGGSDVNGYFPFVPDQNPPLYVQRVLADGSALDAGHGTSGTTQVGEDPQSFQPGAPLRLSDGRLLLFGVQQDHPRIPTWLAVTAQGAFDASVGIQNSPGEPVSLASETFPRGIVPVQFAGGDVLCLFPAYASPATADVVVRLDASLAPDASFGPSGRRAFSAPFNVVTGGWDASQRLVLVGWSGSGSTSSAVVARFLIE